MNADGSRPLPTAPAWAPLRHGRRQYILMVSLIVLAPCANAGIRILGLRPRGAVFAAAMPPSTSSHPAARPSAARPPAPTPAAGSTCVYYGDGVGSQVGLPPPNTTITVTSASLAPAPSVAHGTASVTASIAAPNTLTAAAPPLVPVSPPSPVIRSVANYDAIVTSPNCVSSQFVLTLTSIPPGPGTALEATMAAPASQLLTGYGATYADMGTYLCTYNGIQVFACEVWDVMLNLSLDTTGAVYGGPGPGYAGSYDLVTSNPTYTM